MLQRTGAQQVVPVYLEFLAEFPTLNDAVDHDGEAMRSLLRPLGRTERHRVLRAALRYVAHALGGRFPTSLKRLLRIPGVGPYTARAILVFAHRRRLGLFDPNIYRIINRVFGTRSQKARPHTDPSMWRTADALMPRRRSREMNLALLDLGSTICRTRRPLHERCPLQTICAYYRREKHETLHIH